MSLPNYALNRRVVTCVAVVMLCIWGYLSFQSSPRRETPEFTIRVCAITTVWPGATVENLEQLVTEPLEQAVNSIDEVDRIDSTVTPGLSVIKVSIDDAVPPGDIANLWDEVRAEVDSVSLPTSEGCQPAHVNSNFGDTAVWMLSVYQSPDHEPDNRYSSRELEVFADQLRDQIKRLPNVANATLHGVQDEVIYLESDPRSWSKLALSTQELAGRLAQRNIVSSGGTLDLPVGQVSLKTTGNFSTVDQINQVVVTRDSSGNPVYLQDLGITARRAPTDPPRELFRYTHADPDRNTRGAESVIIAITMKDGRNVVALGEELRAAVDQAHRSLLPNDIETALVIDTPKKVNKTIVDFVSNLFQSVSLVLLVAILLIGVRIAVIMAAAIPVVMLGTFALMRLIDVELEQMSIAALIIALGMLVDNVIEVCDNVLRLLDEGKSRREAAFEGARQIGFPILIATLTTIAAFVPMVIALEGAGSEYVFSIPAVVTIALSVSWILAMTFTTVMSYWFLRKSTGRSPLMWIIAMAGKLIPPRLRRKRAADPEPSAAGQAADDAAGHGGGHGSGGLYGVLARLAIRFKWVTVGVAVGGFAFALYLLGSGRIGSQFFPSADQDKFLVEVYLPDGASIHQTSAACRTVEDLVLEVAREDGQDQVRDILTMVGSGGPRFELGFDPADPASNYGVLLVHTNDPAQVDPMLERVRSTALARIEGARIRPIKFGMGPPVANPIAVRITGPGFADLRKMREIASDTLKVFRSSPRTWDVNQTWGTLGLQYEVDLDESKATTSGVSSADVANSLAGYYSGRYLTTYREGDHQVPVYFRWHPEERRDLDAVLTNPIEGANGKVTLDGIAEGELGYVPVRLTRRNTNRMLEVNAQPTAGHLANDVLLQDIWPQILEYTNRLPEGYDIEIAGELAESAKAQGQMALSFQITLALLILLLIIQYNSISKMLLILVTIPLATTGSFVGMWIFGAPMGFMEMLGLLSLVGIVLNAAIVFIEFAEMRIIERQKENGDGEQDRFSGLDRATFRECLAEAGQLRLLPIALTTLTTAGGLLPLAMSGGPLFEGMATAVICGLLVGSAMTLLVLPALVAIFVENLRIRFVH